MERGRCIAFSDMFSRGPFHRSLYNNLADATITTQEGRSFQVHKAIISQYSEYFQATFSEEFGLRNHIVLSNIDGDTLKDILDYCYTGHVNLHQDTIGNVLLAADYLLLDNLVTKCCDFATQSITTDNCLQLYVIAETIGLKLLRIRCHWFIRIYFKDVINETLDFGKLPLRCLEQILDDKYLNVDSEDIIWKSIVNWVEEDECNRFSKVPQLLTFLNIDAIDEDLSETILSNHIMSSNPFCSSLVGHKNITKQQMIRQLVQIDKKQYLMFTKDRMPQKIHFVVTWDFQTTNDITCYLTYNEELDAWRKLGHLEFFPAVLISMGDTIFLFDILENHSHRYNLSNNQLEPIWPNFFERFCYSVVQVQQNIYLLGGTTEDDTPSSIVERYDPIQNEWDTVSSLIPMTFITAVGLQDRIYAFGYNITAEEITMVTQVYDLEFETWMFTTAPNISRKDFAVIEAEGKIYLIGGRNDTDSLCCFEVYDTFLDNWKSLPDMPYAYFLPGAILLNDEIIVFENSNKRFAVVRPPVYWSLKRQCWRVFRDDSPWSHIERYNFCTITDSEAISSIVRRNRSNSTENTCWTTSPLA